MKYESILKLSERELEVFKLIGEEKSNKEIAKILFISEDTVRSHIKVIYMKYGYSKNPYYNPRRTRLILLSQNVFKKNVIDIKKWNLIKKVIELEERLETLEEKAGIKQ